MGKPTFDNGILSLLPDEGEGFGFPLSNEGIKPLNKIGGFKLTRRTETSQYPEEEKSIEMSQVAASERGGAQTVSLTRGGVVGSTGGRHHAS